MTATARPARMTRAAGRLPPRPSARTEALLLLLGLALVEAVLMGDHVLHGGLYTDDWPIASIERWFGAWGTYSNLFEADRDRPLTALYLALTTAAGPANPHLYALWGLLTHLLCAASIYLLLRVLRLPAVHSGALAVLVLLFPYSDSVWLWHTASSASLCIAFAAVGTALALRGLEREGRPALVHFGGAAVLFAVSVLTYQVAVAAMCLAGVLYLWRASRRRALTAWAATIAVVVLPAVLPRLIFGSPGVTANPVIPLAEQVTHARLLGSQAVTLLAAVVVPVGDARRTAVVPVVALVLALGAVAWIRTPAEDPARARLGRWLLYATGGAVLVAAAYAVYVPAPVDRYQPLLGGSDNRVNALAGVGYAVFAYSLIALGATAAVRLLRRPEREGLVLALGLTALLAVGYGYRVRQDISDWDAAAASQRTQLSQLRALGRPPPGTTLYVFGGTGATASGVYAFGVTWDLNAAVTLLWNDFTLRAYPVFAGTRLSCGVTGPAPVGGAFTPSFGAPYRRAWVVDLRARRRWSVTDPSVCERLARTVVAGPQLA